MQISIKKIPESGLLLHDTLELDDELIIEKESFFLNDLDHHLQLKRDREKILVKGSLNTAVSLKCVRCLEDFEFDVQSKYDVILFPVNMVEYNKVSLESEELEYIFYEGDRIDLVKILAEQINLYIPFNPLCGKDCKGICPNCGLNLNYDSCRCEGPVNEINLFFNKIKR